MSEIWEITTETGNIVILLLLYYFFVAWYFVTEDTQKRTHYNHSNWPILSLISVCLICSTRSMVCYVKQYWLSKHTFTWMVPVTFYVLIKWCILWLTNLTSATFQHFFYTGVLLLTLLFMSSCQALSQTYKHGHLKVITYYNFILSIYFLIPLLAKKDCKLMVVLIRYSSLNLAMYVLFVSWDNSNIICVSF